jgi:serine phosphatase RsbU (regulator of sigma subunit)
VTETMRAYRLIGVDGRAACSRRIAVDAPILVGRGRYNHLVLDDERVSRQHARIALERDGCVVHDLHSANGTLVNGATVTRRVLAPNDLVRFGSCVFRVECDPTARVSDSWLVEDDAPTLSGAARVEEALQVRLKEDLALAAHIQKSFLPREVIAVEGLDLFAEYRAAYTVGGDFYDVLWVAPDRLAVFIGDIAGKGIAGALLMARVSSELRAAALAHVDPETVLKTMNEATLRRDQPELFFTAVYFTIDVKSGEVLLANAGHPAPYWRRARGGVEPITAGRGCAVGILDDPGFTVTWLRLEHGDSLVLYTDGVVEASSADGVLYGQDRLEACLARVDSTRTPSAVRAPSARTPRVIAEEILRSVDEHSAGGPVNDDLTLFICQRSVGAAPTMQPRRRSSIFPAPAVEKPRS